MLLPRGSQGLYIALTLVVIIVIINLAPDPNRALLLISLIVSFLIISTQLTIMRNQDQRCPGDDADDMDDIDDHFAERPAAGAHFPHGNPIPGVTGEYPGGLDAATLANIGYQFGAGDASPAVGPAYTPTTPDPTPFPHNPYQLNRVQTRAERLGDDGMASEARNTHDADRKVVTHARWRHDPYRVAAGVMRKKDQMQRYIGEELDEVEHREWWGNADY